MRKDWGGRSFDVVALQTRLLASLVSFSDRIRLESRLYCGGCWFGGKILKFVHAGSCVCTVQDWLQILEKLAAFLALWNFERC